MATADLAALSTRLRAHWPKEGWIGLAEAAPLAAIACAAAWLIEWLVRRIVGMNRMTC